MADDLMLKAVLCVLGTAGFCVILHVSKSKFAIAVFGGAVSAFTAALFEYAGAGIFKSTLIAMIALCAFSEVTARVVKTPASVIMIPGSIPLLPGGSLYYMMSFLVHFNSEMFYYYARETALTGLGIALGAVIVSIAVKIITAVKGG